MHALLRLGDHAAHAAHACRVPVGACDPMLRPSPVFRFVELTDPIRQAHLNAGNDWLKMARATQAGCDAELVRTAKAHAGDGVLLVADSEKHAEVLLAALAQHAVAAGGFADLADRSKAVIVVTKRQNRGYNEAVRLGSIVTGVYAGNAAARHQLTGRLLRMGQKRGSINHVTVCRRTQAPPTWITAISTPA